MDMRISKMPMLLRASGKTKLMREITFFELSSSCCGFALMILNFNSLSAENGEGEVGETEEES